MAKSLISAVEALKKSPLTPEEVATLQEFQRQFDLDDDDPLNVVLALMARSQMIVETAPGLLQKKVTETIELHRTNLRDQAVLIAKDLVGEVSTAMVNKQKSLMDVWRQRTLWFGAGSATTLVLMFLVLAGIRFLR